MFPSVFLPFKILVAGKTHIQIYHLAEVSHISVISAGILPEVAVEVAAAGPVHAAADHVAGVVRLPELGVGAGPVDEDLDAVHAHADVRAVRGPQLLADLVPHARVHSGDNRVPEGNLSQKNMVL